MSAFRLKLSKEFEAKSHCANHRGIVYQNTSVLYFSTRNSIVAGWFLAEFHIAHEQVVNGRKKYIIPLMLEKIKAGEIQDADLRMYVESHTYLDCNDKVCLVPDQMLELLDFVSF